MSASRAPQLVVFSDLDGTLLDHTSYDHAPAEPALHALRERGIPLVLVTSKTRPEVVAVRARLGNRDPFAVENGGAVYAPPGSLPGLTQPVVDGLVEVALGVPYARVRTVLAQLRRAQGFQFEGFGDVSAERVAEWTGLSVAQARDARARACSEPIRFEGDAESLTRFAAALAHEGLQLVRGGRFHSVQGKVDKGTAVRFVIERMSADGERPITAALGDSPNDLPMLMSVDYPIVIPAAGARPALSPEHPRLFTAPEPGPSGFRRGIEQLLERLSI